MVYLNIDILDSVQVTNYLQEMAPNLCERVELHGTRTPLFDEYNIEEEINNILSKRWRSLCFFLLALCLL